MALKLYWRCGGATLDSVFDFSAGDTVATVNSTAAFNTDAVFIGVNGLDCPSSNDHAWFDVTSGDLINSTTGSFGFWTRIVSYTNAALLFQAYNTGAATNFITVLMVGTDDSTGRELRFQIRQAGNPSHSITTTGADLEENVWYFVLGRYDQTANDIRLEIYNDDGSLRTSVEDLTTSYLVPTGINRLAIGESGGTAVDMHIDNVFVADAYSEPIEDFMFITKYDEYGLVAGAIPKFMNQYRQRWG